uniref:Transposase Tc1-like domain-containing protein n=1 Tax=Cyprinus carpio carpio TaxID=630221 RepID=A0A9J8B7J3_CYPCA
QLSKRRPLTPCTRRVRHKRSLQKRLAVHRALCPSTLTERQREGKYVIEKKCTSNRDNRTLERIVKQNPLKNVVEIHKEWTADGVSASRTTTQRHMQDMGFSCRIPFVKPLLNNRQRQKRLASKRTELLLSSPKLCALMNLPHIFEWVLFHNPLQGVVIPIACTLFSITSFPSIRLSINVLGHRAL